MGQRGELFSSKVTAESERRTYFFNVKENRKGDRFMTIVESTKQPNGEFERHELFVYEEDLYAFMRGLEDAAKHVREKGRDKGFPDGGERRDRSDREDRDRSSREPRERRG